MSKCVQRLACKDISEEIKNRNLKVTDGYGDVWVVTSRRLVNSEITKLNKELGINSINYQKNKNGFKYKK